MSDIKITKRDAKVVLTAPYHPAFPSKARELNGKYEPPSSWAFDARDEDRVRALAIEIYGTDGDVPVELVTVHLDIDAYAPDNPKEFWFAGRKIAGRSAKYQPVRLGDDVIVVTGGFPARGGSVNNPRISCEDGTVLEIRDLPRPAVEAEPGTGFTIVDTRIPDRPALEAERERLLARLADIDALLKETTQ